MGGTCPLGGEIQVTYFEQHSAPKSLWEILPESFQNDDSDEECETIVINFLFLFSWNLLMFISFFFFFFYFKK